MYLLNKEQIEELKEESVKELITEVKSYDRAHGAKLSNSIIKKFFQDQAPKYDSLAAVEQALHSLYKRNGIETTSQGVKQVISNYKKRVDLSKQERNKPTEIKEESLNALQNQKKEKIVKSMKKDFKKFKSKYGDDAKAVIYATATKLAKDD